MVRASLTTVGVAILMLVLLPCKAAAQAVRGVVLDQTGLPLPGATVEVHEGPTVTVRDRMADVGVQLFNATNHFNPRDVYPVAGARNHGRFTNSVGLIVRGFMTIKW